MHKYHFCLTKNNHPLYHKIFIIECWNRTPVFSREFSSRVDNVQCSMHGGSVVWCTIVELESSSEDTQILRFLTRYPLVNRSRPVVEKPLNHQSRIRVDLFWTESILAVQYRCISWTIVNCWRNTKGSNLDCANI